MYSLDNFWLIFLLSNIIFPWVTLSKPTTARPIVVLPEPDSPTKENVSPLLISPRVIYIRLQNLYKLNKKSPTLG